VNPQSRPISIGIPKAITFVLAILLIPIHGAAQVLGDPTDVSRDFRKMENSFFVGSRVSEFEAASGKGSLVWDRYRLATTLSFNKVDIGLTRAEGDEFPGTEYDRDPSLPFSISFISPRTIRLRFNSRNKEFRPEEKLMIPGPVPTNGSWRVEEKPGEVIYTSVYGKVRLIKDPWHIEFYDAKGRLLTRTENTGDPHSYLATVPFSFVRRAEDLNRRFAATFELQHDEKIFGTGESFTRLNKRGQVINATTRDGMGVQGPLMYKPIPFFLSSNGYGMFVHTSAPITFDFGASFDQHNTIYSADDELDIFIFLGEPKEILGEYTALTGRSPVPPLWSLGFWMSRITYKSEEEVRKVAADLRKYRIPADVIHLDTGWFETDWQSDFEFSKSRFKDPQKMIADLKEKGFHISLWQYSYFTPKNRLFKEIVENGLEVKNESGSGPFEDAVLDMSNPETVEWYKAKLSKLLRMGVGAIKVDFGEGAPISGQYASGRTGLYEHNLYPLRYNKAVSDLTKATTGDSIIWARSAWAGSQRYPVHWGGDAENTNSAMAATLRAGLSLGLCGFSFWSHDAGGFVDRPSEDLYRRWMAFSVLTSHTRAHGAPPREPWEYSESLTEDFRNALELRYSLMPYIYSQAFDSSSKGFPMLRTLFYEFPGDETSWMIEDEYMLGSELLVAPLFETGATSRKVYLPPGVWTDFQSERSYEGGRWHTIDAGRVPIVLLARDHSVIPEVKAAQNTGAIDWTQVNLRVFSSDGKKADGYYASPEPGLKRLSVTKVGGNWKLVSDPSVGKVRWTFEQEKR
jgi:alpha-D-xyloside xylohydrolase